MPSIELSKLQGVSAPRALAESDRAQLDQRGQQSRSAAPSDNAAGVKLEVGAAIEAGKPPVDNERVAEIRDALREGRYPLIPARIADAMIAARIGFGVNG